MGEPRFKLRLGSSGLDAPRPNSTRQTKAAGDCADSGKLTAGRVLVGSNNLDLSDRRPNTWNVELSVTTKQLPAVVCGRERMRRKESCRQKEILAMAGLTGEEVATPSNHSPAIVGHLHLPVGTLPWSGRWQDALTLLTGLNGQSTSQHLQRGLVGS